MGLCYRLKYQFLKAVLGIRDILMRMLIPGFVPLTNRSGSGFGSDTFLQNAKKIIPIFLSYNVPARTLSSVLIFGPPVSGSGSISQRSGSGSGYRRPENVWIQRVLIPNTV
jgi:hypothetical protein